MHSIKLMKNNNFSWRKVLNILVWSLLFSGVFVIPLLMPTIGSVYSSFDLWRIAALKVFIVLAFSATLIREIFFPALAWNRFVFLFKKYWLIPAIFIATLALLLLFSGQADLSFYGSYGRQNGFLSYLLYFLWFLILSFNLFVLPNKEALKTKINFLAGTVLLSSVFVSIYALLQYLGIDFFNWQYPAHLTGRSFSTLGQPNFLGSFLLLSWPLPIYFFLIWKKFILKFCASLSFIFILSAIFTTASRGAFLALFLSLFLAAVYKFFFGNFSRIKKIVFSLTLLLLMSALLLLTEKAMPGRITSMFDLKYGSSAARWNIYSSALSLIAEKPWFGYGQENLQSSFFLYYQSDWGLHEDISQVADKAHNLFLDILLSGGIVSLLAHFVLYGFFCFLFWRLIRKKNLSSSLSLAIFVGAVSYLASLLFSFSVPSTEFYFFVLFALLVGLNFYEFDAESIITPVKKRLSFLKKYFSLSFILVFAAFFLYRSANYFFADYYFNSAALYFMQARLPEGIIVLEYSDKSCNNDFYRGYYNYTAAKILSSYYPYKGERATNQMIKERLEYALSFPTKQVTDIYKRVGIEKVLGDYKSMAIDLDKLKALAPNWPDFNLMEAAFYFELADYDSALRALDVLWSNLPDINNPVINADHIRIARSYRAMVFYYRAKIYQAQNKLDLSLENYRLAYQENPIDYMILKEAADMEFSAGNFDNALNMVLQGHKLSPKDFNWPLMVHYIYEKKGKAEEAAFWLSKAEDLGYMPELDSISK